MNFIDEESEEQRHSEISCEPNCTAAKVLVDIVRTKYDRGKTFYVLELSLVGTEIKWVVERRYSEFLELRDEVYDGLLRRNVSQCFGCRWFANSLRDFGFPRKHLLSSKEREIIRFRKTRLNLFARLISSHTFSAIPKCVVCRETPFGRIREFFTANAQLPSRTTLTQLQTALVPERFAAIADPLKSKIEFRRGHGIFRVIQVEKPILNQWSEIEDAMRTKRLQRRYSSTSRLGTQHEASETVQLDEEKHAVPLPLEGKDKPELVTTGNNVVAIENSVTLQPLTLTKHDRAASRADASACRLYRWDLASPTHSAA